MTPHLVLKRFAYSPMGTFGTMMVDGVTLYTVERPWLNNMPSVSCIPEGEYRCAPRHFFRGGYETIEILGVPGRSHILFHKGNVASDVEGCVAVGSNLGALGHTWAVLGSQAGLSKFLEIHGDKTFSLLVDGPNSALMPDILTISGKEDR